MRLVLSNLASPANPGDMAILRGTLKLLGERFGRYDAVLSTRYYSQRAAFEALGHSVVPSYPDVEAMDQDSAWNRVTSLPRMFRDPAPLREAVRSADAVLLAGGAYFYSYRRWAPGLTYWSHFTAQLWARRFHKPVIWLPQSFGPFVSRVSRLMFGHALRSADLAFYREPLSGQWIKNNHPRFDRAFFLPDLALLLQPEDFGVSPDPGPATGRIGVTVRPWGSRSSTETYLDSLSTVLTELAREGKKIRIVVQVRADKSTEGDEAVSRQLENRLLKKSPRESVECCSASPRFDLPAIARLYRECDWTISMRLHGALLNFILGRPALVVGYQHKAEGILKSLGLEALYAGAFDEIGPEGLRRCVEKFRRELPEWREAIGSSLRTAREAIRLGFAEKTKRVFA
jgi:colanic acid/amylovoran biosynthesis protein